MRRTRKDRIKAVRAVLEAICLLALLLLIVRALFSFKRYEPYDKSAVTGNTADASGDGGSTGGFVALSYFGVDRNGDETLISTARLEEQLRTLYEQGYVTVTQEDIRDYYENGTPLPEKSLFLMFEDGRRDTSIFAQKILETYNFKASMLTYAEKFEVNDPKFLSARDLLEMEDSTFWELGTNGYRLFYINVFDRYGYYLGERNTLEYAMMSGCLGRDYNHYLMDYIRDRYGVPKESYQGMYARISADYEGMEREYTDKIGELPGLYSLMHANTGQFGNNEKVSDTNAEWIYKLFDMNFNREGDCWNTAAEQEHTIYDLTRMQPQPYWYINHLLMRIKDDSGLETRFVNGDEEEYQNWNVLRGALECKTEKLVVTCEPEADGAVLLRDVSLQDGQLDVTLTGNKLGTQTVWLRADEELETAVCVSVQNNVLKVAERAGGSETELFSLDLDEFDGLAKVSVEEDEKAVRLQELAALTRYADDVKDAGAYMSEAKKVETWQTRSVAEGAEEYVPDIDIREAGKRKLSVTLQGAHLKICVDGRTAAEDIEVSNVSGGRIGLGSRWGGFGWSRRNLADDVYDGVFEKLSVRTLPDADGDSEVVYDNLLHGAKKLWLEVSRGWMALINWFIKYL